MHSVVSPYLVFSKFSHICNETSGEIKEGFKITLRATPPKKDSLSPSKIPTLSAHGTLNESSRISFNYSLGSDRDGHVGNLTQGRFHMQEKRVHLLALPFKENNEIQANLDPKKDNIKDDPCFHCGPDQNMENTSGLCSRSSPGHWVECRAALADELGLGNITCPEACVTFERYGRFNNNIIQLVNLIMNFIHPFSSKKDSSKSIVLADFWKPYFANYAFDFDQLEKVCVFPSWEISGRPQRVGNCQNIDAESTYFGGGVIQPRGSRHVLYNQLISWLLVGAVSETTRMQVDAQLADLGEDFSALHARFLEGECTSAICQMSGGYIEAEMKKLGHSTEVFVVCTDHQRQDLVIPVVAHMNGTLITDRYMDPVNSVITSKYLLSLIGGLRPLLNDAPSPLFDLLVMIHAKRFLGNKISSMAGNIQRVRTAIFGNVTGVTV
jgi:hypothetical protein